MPASSSFRSYTTVAFSVCFQEGAFDVNIALKKNMAKIRTGCINYDFIK
jgi:hypothetical protein